MKKALLQYTHLDIFLGQVRLLYFHTQAKSSLRKIPMTDNNLSSDQHFIKHA